ncbi:DedA family protein [Candidatus Bathyarchaeota archaeon]|nr:DedA family protein [Candidatus Bathyarchaeota archaeon]
MTITETIFNFVVSLASQLGYPGIFVLMVMESATLPVPSEVVLPIGGYLVYKGVLDFWTVVAVATLGSLVGTMIDYSIGFYLGRPAVLRYGRIVRFSQERLETSEKWFGQHGKSVVLLARFVPLLRTLIAFPAGIVRMDWKRFLAYSAVGILVWDIALVYLGEVAGQNSSQISSVLEAYFLPLGVAALVIVAIMAYRSLRSRDRGSGNG